MTFESDNDVSFVFHGLTLLSLFECCNEKQQKLKNMSYCSLKAEYNSFYRRFYDRPCVYGLKIVWTFILSSDMIN